MPFGIILMNDNKKIKNDFSMELVGQSDEKQKCLHNVIIAIIIIIPIILKL